MLAAVCSAWRQPAHRASGTRRRGAAGEKKGRRAGAEQLREMFELGREEAERRAAEAASAVQASRQGRCRAAPAPYSPPQALLCGCGCAQSCVRGFAAKGVGREDIKSLRYLRAGRASIIEVV